MADISEGAEQRSRGLETNSHFTLLPVNGENLWGSSVTTSHIEAGCVEPDFAIADHRAVIATEQHICSLSQYGAPDRLRKYMVEVTQDRSSTSVYFDLFRGWSVYAQRQSDHVRDGLSIIGLHRALQFNEKPDVAQRFCLVLGETCHRQERHENEANWGE
ncbi:hypothetical protein [Sphingopyxis sp.]|uniref:hypothetical protein n=1 Tax=Sphingopyxis sp. TaxID=1908224 RepID=UPI002DEDDC18|nr:hypothetical protein [Sphingopyxis sp.]